MRHTSRSGRDNLKMDRALRGPPVLVPVGPPLKKIGALPPSGVPGKAPSHIVCFSIAHEVHGPPPARFESSKKTFDS